MIQITESVASVFSDMVPFKLTEVRSPPQHRWGSNRSACNAIVLLMRRSLPPTARIPSVAHSENRPN